MPQPDHSGVDTAAGPARRFGLANTLTAVRALLIVPSVLCILEEAWALAMLVFALAVITDVLDGRVARARNEASALGGLFDHSVDAVFVASSLAVLASQERLPGVLPVLVLLAFAQYTLDSKALRGAALRTSRLGRNNGIGYYVLLGVAIGAELPVGAWIAGEWVTLMAWGLTVTTLVSMLDRAWTWFRTVRESA